jgi:histidyl-tRNA synthetase
MALSVICTQFVLYTCDNLLRSHPQRVRIPVEVMNMDQLKNSPFEAALDVVATLRDRAIQAQVDSMQRQDELTKALRAALKSGVSMDSLSEASGLTITEIERRVSRELLMGEDLDTITGIR